MNTEVKARWIAALRSGEYKQGFKTLHSEDGCFCALGVLCDLYAKHFECEWEKQQTLQTLPGYDSHFVSVFALTHHYGGESFYSVAVPADPVAAWAGTSQNPRLNAISHCGVSGGFFMSEINDKLKLSFAEIADLIEEQL